MLDRDIIEINKDLSEAETNFISAFKKRKKQYIEDDDLLSEINAHRLRSRQIQDEKVTIAENLLLTIEKFIKKIDIDLGSFENELRCSGSFETLGADPGTEVAIKLDLYIDDWILGKVLFFNGETGYYDIADFDDTTKRYNLPETQVIILQSLKDEMKKLNRGDEVLAVYPDTTSFYQAIVAHAPKKALAGSETLAVQVN